MRTPSSPRLLGAVFASGASVMIVEMTAVRAMQPFFGSTSVVWTNVIGVVLFALSIGYVAGGRLADRWPTPRLLYGVMAATGALLVAVAWLVTPVSQGFLADGVDLEGIVTVLLFGSLGTTLVLFAPPILMMGAVSPLAIRLLEGGGVGRAAGRVFAVGTAGSLLGTYLPAVWLVPAVGSRGSILFAAAALGIVGGLGLGRRGIVPIVIAGAALASIPFAAPARGVPGDVTGTVLAEVESPYQYLTVRDDEVPGREKLRILTINEGVYTYHSLKVDGQILTGSRYYDDYSLLPLLLDLAPGEELRGCILGMACGVNAMQWKHFWGDVYDLRVDGAEIDPEIVRLGREHFGMPGPEADWLRVYAMDGRPMLEATPASPGYHLIVVDAFTNELYTPFHLATREFFDLCESRLAPGGVLAMNVYAVGDDAPNLHALENTLATSFGSCLRVSQYWGSNFLLLARRGDAPPDLSRLDPVAARKRYRDWPGYVDWRMKPELDDLLAKGPPLVKEAFRIEPSTDEWVLTDDHAPLEALTDRFIGSLESRALTNDEWRRDELKVLIERQRSRLALIGAVWLAALALGWWALRRAGRSRAGG